MIYRGKYNEILYEFVAPPEATATVILCDGLPSVPKQKELIQSFANRGYFTVFPRYQGTWESAGTFLAHSPADDIRQLAKHLQSDSIYELYNKKEFTAPNSIHLVGSSFGGAVALCLADATTISSITALSPVVDFATHNQKGDEQDLVKLGSFIHDAFPYGYRTHPGGWQQLLAGGLLQPSQALQNRAVASIQLLADSDDPEVTFATIKNFAAQYNCDFTRTHQRGHLSFSKLTPDLIEQLNFTHLTT